MLEPPPAPEWHVTCKRLTGSSHRGCRCRFIKVPLRPEGTEDWTEEQLQALVTRDAVIGVRHAKNVEDFKKEGGVFNPKSEG